MKIQTILLPTDFSNPALEAGRYAVDLARTFKAKLHLFYAYHFPPFVVMPQSVAVPGAFWSDLENSAMEQLGRLRAELNAEDLDIELATRDSEPGSAIAEYAEEIGADLIVMGTRGLTGIKHALLGSTAERALRLAPCPVITLKESAG